MSTPAAPAGRPDVWVVNGRVIRFLDPSRPEESVSDRGTHRGLGGLLAALRPHRRTRARG